MPQKKCFLCEPFGYTDSNSLFKTENKVLYYYLRGTPFTHGEVLMKLLASNKRAHFDYTIEDKLVVGLILFGYEVKSCKLGQGRIADALVRIEDNALRIHNMDIPLYEKASQIASYQPKRKRKLLATKQQILRWYTKTQKGNATLLPLDLHIDARNRLKLTLGLGVLNKKFDKKAKIKQKDTDKITQQELKRIRA